MRMRECQTDKLAYRYRAMYSFAVRTRYSCRCWASFRHPTTTRKPCCRKETARCRKCSFRL